MSVQTGSKQTDVANMKQESKQTNSTQAYPPRKSSRASNKPNPHPSKISQPASPPPSYISNPRATGTNHIPAYWSHSLSNKTTRWLEQPGTKSKQTSPLRLDLCSRHREGQGTATKPIIIIDPRQYAKVKLMRLSLPASVAQKGMQPPGPQLLEWFVLQVNYKVTERAEQGMQGTMDHDAYGVSLVQGVTTPHWIIAFPFEAITAAKMQLEEVPLLQVVESARPQSKPPNKKMRRAEGSIHVTRLVLGNKGRVPLVHGRGVDPLFAQGFMQACAAGAGVVELRTEEPFAPMLQ